MPALILRLFFILSLTSGIVWSTDKNSPPHIILVMSDDHGYGDCGYTGHPFVQTPNLDAMAKAGVVFNRFYSSAPVCSPTRASVLTGRHPFRVNVPNHGHYLRPQESTIAEKLKEAGYVTGHFGKWHIGSVQPDSPTSPGGAGFDEWLSGLNFFDNNPYLSRNGEYEQIKGAGTVITMDATLDFLEKQNGKGKPIFIVTWFPSPHAPHPEIPEGMPNASRLYNEQDTNLKGYFREITLLDQQIGRLREKLRSLNIEQNTLLFYSSDNGGLDQKTSGGRAKKGSIYEGGLRIPAILEWPARFSPKEIDTPCVSSDLYPTLLGIAGLKRGKGHPPLDGTDIMPIISGKKNKRAAIGFWHGFRNGQSTWNDRIIKALLDAKTAGKPNPHPERILKNVNEFESFDQKNLIGHAAWNAWPWKLHRIQTPKETRFELYNLETDPMESDDLLKKQSKRVNIMTTALEKWQKSVLDSWSGRDYSKKY